MISMVTEGTFICTTCSGGVLVHGILLGLQPLEISPNTSPQVWCISFYLPLLDGCYVY